MSFIYYPAAGALITALLAYNFKVGNIFRIINASIPELPRPKKSDRILVFAPHEDDEMIAAGGLIAESIKAGASIRVIIVTDGNKYGMKRFRYRESVNAGKIIGLSKEKITFWNFKDGHLFKEANEMIRRMVIEISAFKPSIIVFPSPIDYHRDHSTLGTAISSYLKGESWKGTKLQYLVHYPSYPYQKSYEPKAALMPPLALFTKEHTKWRKFTLSKETMAAKEKAIDRYKTQLVMPALGKLIYSFIRKNELFYMD